MPKIDITGTRGEVNFAGPRGKLFHHQGDMDEIVVGITLEGAMHGHPVALSFEDAFDMALLNLDLTLEQAEEFGKTLLQTVEARREMTKK